MSIGSNIRALHASLPAGIRLVAVSKTHTAEEILEAYQAGQRIFGENRVKEMAEKQPQLPGDIEWHFIGHLQTNKVKVIAPFVHCVQSIDSLHLLTELDKEAAKHNRVIDGLLQFYIAREETKYGLNPDEADAILSSREFEGLRNVRITGVMGMATLTGDTARIREEFRMLKGTFESIRLRFFAGKEHFREISMGMSSDYPVAVEEGATILRIGTLIFENNPLL